MRRASIPLAAAIVFAAVYQLTPSPKAAPAAAGEPVAPAGAYYPGCDSVRAAGAAPLYRGQPGYRPEMDGDDDGIACEPYRGRW
jgi:hypothetical protein